MLPNQWMTLIIGAFVAGCIITAVAVSFILKNYYERKRRRPTPFVESFMRRFGDAVYDDRFAKVTDREFIKLLENTSIMCLFLYKEAANRLTRKVEKDNKKAGQ